MFITVEIRKLLIFKMKINSNTNHPDQKIGILLAVNNQI